MWWYIKHSSLSNQSSFLLSVWWRHVTHWTLMKSARGTISPSHEIAIEIWCDKCDRTVLGWEMNHIVWLFKTKKKRQTIPLIPFSIMAPICFLFTQHICLKPTHFSPRSTHLSPLVACYKLRSFKNFQGCATPSSID